MKNKQLEAADITIELKEIWGKNGSVIITTGKDSGYRILRNTFMNEAITFDGTTWKRYYQKPTKGEELRKYLENNF